MRPSGPHPSDELAGRLDSLLANAVGRRHVRHGLMVVADIDGSWRWEAAHGVADPAGTPATPDIRYPIASVTKLFTASIVMSLIDQNSLTLRDRIVDLLPEEVTRGLHVMDGVDRTDEITVEHLLAHTSGLPDYYAEAPRGARSPQDRLLAGEDAPMPFDEVVRVVRDQLAPHFPPQPADESKNRAHYSDTNYQLVGAILERICEQPLDQVFDQMLFEPLGLDDTSSYPHPPPSGGSPEPRAHVWSKDQVLQPQGALRHQGPDGGIISTLADQVRFLRALVGGEVVDGAWQRMQQRFNRVFFPVDYGLGVMRYAPPRWMSPFAPVPTIVGHTGSTATWLFYCSELRIVTAGTFDVAQPPLPFRFLPRVLRSVQKSTS